MWNWGLALAWFIPILLGFVVALVLTGPGNDEPKSRTADHDDYHFLSGV